MNETHEIDERRTAAGTAARARRRLSLVVVAAACLAFAPSLLPDRGASASPTGAGWATHQLSPDGATNEVSNEPATAQGAVDYSKFRHTNPQHARLPCLLCHRRESNSPRPVRSAGHTPCSGCHTQQFADASNPVCTICHANPSSGAVKPFPPLRTFNVRFDHATHARPGARPAASCAACHQPTRRGVALSIPAGLAAHTTCYRCHAPRTQVAGRDLGSCDNCHRVGGYRRTPESANAYRVGFSHAAHARAGASCNDCHTLRAGAAQGRQVTSPQPLQHHAAPRAQSCMTCHDDRRAFGGDDFADCTRCHRGNAWHF